MTAASFKEANARQLVEILHRTGEDPGARCCPEFTKTLFPGGCTDPDHCPCRVARPGFFAVVTKVSGNRLHKLAVAEGLIPPRWRLTWKKTLW